MVRRRTHGENALERRIRSTATFRRNSEVKTGDSTASVRKESSAESGLSPNHGGQQKEGLREEVKPAGGARALCLPTLVHTSLHRHASGQAQLPTMRPQLHRSDRQNFAQFPAPALAQQFGQAMGSSSVIPIIQIHHQRRHPGYVLADSSRPEGS